MNLACCGPDEPSPPPEPDDCCQPGSDNHDHNAAFMQLPPWWRDRALVAPTASGVLLLVGYILEWSGVDVTATIVQTGALLAGAGTFVPGAIRRLLRGRLGVSLLMTIAAVGAVLLGHVAEAAALAFLFSVAEALEARAMRRARHGLRALLTLIPETARLRREGGDVTVPASEVRVSDALVVAAGERIPTDGVVTSGLSHLDTSAVTGESIPVDVGPDDPVPAGAVNGSGTLHVEATAHGQDNSLTTIVRLVEAAQATKGRRARLADRMARPLVPAVLVLAGLIAAFGFLVGDPGTWIERALVVLVAASPCALAIAVPVTVVSAIGSASKFGVVVKSGAAFEQLGVVRRVVFDKTGTLTRNRPGVVEVAAAAGFSDAEVLRIAAGLEAACTHPLATAIVGAASAPAAVTDVVEEAGRGIVGRLHDKQARVGSVRWVDPGPLAAHAESMAARGMSVVVVALDSAAVGVVGIRDEPKPEAAEAVRLLHAQGVETTMLTGDNARTAHTLAAELGIEDVHAEQLPQDKADAINKHVAAETTAMIGDGVNDSPALAAASVGISMGAAGSAAAVESADVAFTGADLRLIPQALAHAKRGRRIMVGNIALALAIIVVLFPLALFGVLGLAGVVLVHEVAEVVVIANGVRAARAPRSVTGSAAMTRERVTEPV